MNFLPDPINNLIITHIKFNKFLLNISLINKNFNKLNKQNLLNLKQLDEIIKKYNYKEIFYDDNALLYDMVSTGCTFPFSNSTYHYYNKSISDDIKYIIKFNPSCLNFSNGYLRCRSNVTPVYMACINENIPIEIVKILIKKNKNFFIKLNGHKIFFLDDIYHNISLNRCKKIKRIFNQVYPPK